MMSTIRVRVKEAYWSTKESFVALCVMFLGAQDEHLILYGDTMSKGNPKVRVDPELLQQLKAKGITPNEAIRTYLDGVPTTQKEGVPTTKKVDSVPTPNLVDLTKSNPLPSCKTCGHLLTDPYIGVTRICPRCKTEN